jgi:large subunit ribosomal protein L13
MSEIERKWYVVDADGQVLGRLATQVATILRGKHKTSFVPHLDVGDHVVVLNAAKVHLTGRKLKDKLYRWHTGYIGGLKEVSAEQMLDKHPERVVEWAVQGMLPKNRLGRAMAKKLKVYRGAEHPHSAQQPTALALRTSRLSKSAEGR